MRLIIALSRYLGLGDHNCFRFHFRGVYKGHYVNEILVDGSREVFLVGEDYILLLEPQEIIGSSLRTRLVKFRIVSEEVLIG